MTNMTVFIVSKFHLELIKGKQLRQKKKVMHTCEEGNNSGPKIKCTQLLGLENIFTI